MTQEHAGTYSQSLSSCIAWNEQQCGRNKTHEVMKLSKYKTHQKLHCIPQILYQEEEKKAEYRQDFEHQLK